MENTDEREARIKHLFSTIGGQDEHIDLDAFAQFLQTRYEQFDNMDEIACQLINIISRSGDGINYTNFRDYIYETEQMLENAFHSLDDKKDGRLDFDEIMDGFKKLDFEVEADKAHMFFDMLDHDQDGYISLEDWNSQLVFVPYENEDSGSPLEAAYLFFIDEMDLSSEGDVLLNQSGIGYFLAGGLAGVVSRTCTAPFDRLKVFLIAQSGSTSLKTASQAAAKAGVESIYKGINNSATSVASSGASVSTSASSSAKVGGHNPTPNVANAIKAIWKQGGLRSFFVGNGLNAVKVFPESAMKFGSFEAAKRVLSKIEGVADPSELSRASTFLAGGIGGMVAQLFIYPIDTLKFRVQCEAHHSPYRGNKLLVTTIRNMWDEAGLRVFYRGLYVGVLGIFPFAALDLGTFSAMKRAYIASQALKLDIDTSEVKLGNLVVLTMGALSGSVGASVVYPVNLLRTRLQAQGTSSHPYRYKGFRDVFIKTVERDGYRGLFRGLAPSLAKVAPAVSISYLVYEKAKAAMNLA